MGAGRREPDAVAGARRDGTQSVAAFGRGRRDGAGSRRRARARTLPDWSGQGALAYVERRREIDLWRVRADAPSAPVKVASSSDLNSSPSISPDGSQVAFRSARSGTNEIWLTGLLESRPTRLTWTNGALTGSPNWSPDGQWIAFDSRVAGNSDILLAPAKGGPWRKLTDTPSNEIVPRWSRDGQWVYFGSDRGGRWQVWKQRPSGGAAEQVTWGGGYVAAESPDGAYVYFTRGPDEQGLYRMPAAGGVEELILPGFAGKLWGNWAVAAKGVYYLDYPAREPPRRGAPSGFWTWLPARAAKCFACRSIRFCGTAAWRFRRTKSGWYLPSWITWGVTYRCWRDSGRREDLVRCYGEDCGSNQATRDRGGSVRADVSEMSGRDPHGPGRAGEWLAGSGSRQ